MLEQLKYLAPPGGSDHAALEFNFIFSITSSNLNRTVLLYDKGDYEKMKQLFNRDWTQVLQSMNPQEAFNTLEKSLHRGTELCIPSNVITDVGRYKPLWMNKQALRKARKKHLAWIRYLNTKSGEHYQDYIRTHNESSHESRRARKDFERKLAAETKTNNKGFWNYVNSRRKTRTKIADLRTNSGAFTSDDLDKADILNQQYAPLQLRTFPAPLISDQSNYKPNLSKQFT